MREMGKRYQSLVQKKCGYKFRIVLKQEFHMSVPTRQGETSRGNKRRSALEHRMNLSGKSLGAAPSGGRLQIGTL